MDLASLFAGPAAAVRIIFYQTLVAEPARQFAKTLNQGLGSVDLLQPGRDIAQPCQIGLAGLLAEGQFGILQFPK